MQHRNWKKSFLRLVAAELLKNSEIASHEAQRLSSWESVLRLLWQVVCTLATQILSLLCNLLAVLAHGSCHCETCRIHGAAIYLLVLHFPTFVIAKEWKDFFAKPKCEPATSHTCGVVEAISLLVDRRTTFAMTSCFSVPLACLVLKKLMVLGNGNSHKCGCRCDCLWNFSKSLFIKNYEFR